MSNLNLDDACPCYCLPNVSLLIIVTQTSFPIAILCSDIQYLNYPGVLTYDNITGMASQEFDDCLETFGMFTEWDEMQLMALVNRTKEVGESPIENQQKC